MNPTEQRLPLLNHINTLAAYKNMNQKAFILLLGVIYISGCVSSNVLDAIPTENLPLAITFEKKADQTKAVESFSISKDDVKRMTSFIYSFAPQDDGGGAQIDVFELKGKANFDLEAGDKGELTDAPEAYDFKEESINVEGVTVTHLHAKYRNQKTMETFSIRDFYYIELRDAIIRIRAGEFPEAKQGNYDALGLELTKIIVRNLKADKLV